VYAGGQQVSEVAADLEIDLHIQAQQEQEEQEEEERRRAADAAEAWADDSNGDFAAASPGPSAGPDGHPTSRTSGGGGGGGHQPVTMFMRAKSVGRLHHHVDLDPGAATPPPATSPRSRSPFAEPSPSSAVHAYSVPSSPFTPMASLTSTAAQARQPALLVRQLRSMPAMPSAWSDGGSDTGLDAFSVDSPAHRSHAHAHAAAKTPTHKTVAIGVGLAALRSPPQHGQGQGQGRHRSDLSMSAILSTPGGPAGRGGGSMFSPTSASVTSARGPSSTSKRGGPGHDVDAIREAYGTARRGHKRTKGAGAKHGSALTAWAEAPLPADPEAAAAARAARASDALKRELMQSLATMQRHTERVKDNIMDVQRVVDVGAGNPKVRAPLRMCVHFSCHVPPPDRRVLPPTRRPRVSCWR
jgi:hypothetical protein